MKGKLIVISGLSGAGKGTIASELIKRSKNFVLSISATTRDKRNGEIDGVHYFFKTKDEFEKMINENALLEYAKYVDNYYGTPKAYVEENINNGINVILEIEMQGALKIKKLYSDAVLIFIIPRDAKTQKERLIGRGRENDAQVKERLMQAVADAEYAKYYDYVLVNDDIEDTMKDMTDIVAGTYDKKRNEEATRLLNILVGDIKGGNYV